MHIPTPTQSINIPYMFALWTATSLYFTAQFNCALYKKQRNCCINRYVPFSPSYSAAHSKRDLHTAPAAPCRQAACCAAPLAFSLSVTTALLLSLPTSTALRSLPLLSHSCLLRAYLCLLSSLSLSLRPACPQLATTNSKSFSDILFCSAHSRCPTHGNSIRESEWKSDGVRATDNCERAQTGRAPQHCPCRSARTWMSESDRDRNRVRVSCALAFCTQHSCSVVVVINAALLLLLLPPPLVFCLLFCGRRWQGHWKMSPCKCDAYRGLATIQGDLLEYARLKQEAV